MIKLKDDHLDRLHALLMDYKTGIAEAEGQLKQLGLDISRAKFEQASSRKATSVRLTSYASGKKRDHHEYENVE